MKYFYLIALRSHVLFLRFHLLAAGFCLIGLNSQAKQTNSKIEDRNHTKERAASCLSSVQLNQVVGTGDGTPSQIFSPSMSIYDVEAADEFVLPVASALQSLSIQGSGNAPDTFVLIIYRDNSGVPGMVVYNQTFINPNFTVSPSFNLSACPVLPAGTYWLSVRSVASMSIGQWFWSTASDGQGNSWLIRNPSDGFGTGCTDWSGGASCGFANGTGPGLVWSLTYCITDHLAAVGPNCRNLNTSLDANGNTGFYLSDVVTNFSAAAPARVTIRRSFGTAVFGPAIVYTQPIIFNACALQNETLVITVETEGGNCWSNLTFKQVDGPTIESRNYSVFCFDPLAKKPDLNNRPLASIPCQSAVRADFVTDWLISYPCEPGIQDTVKIVYREWESYDKRGRRGVSFDTIVVLNLPEIDSAHIYCEDRDTLYCSDTTTLIGPYITFENIDLTCDTLRLIHISDLNNDGKLEFHPKIFDAKCGLDVHVDAHLFQGECGYLYKVTVNVKQSCYGPADLTCLVMPEAGTAPNSARQIAPGYWRCEFWLYDLDTVAPELYCKGQPLFEGPFEIKNWEVYANPFDEVITSDYFDPYHHLNKKALPYHLSISSHFEPQVFTSQKEEEFLLSDGNYFQKAGLRYRADENITLDFAWKFHLPAFSKLQMGQSLVPAHYTNLSFEVVINGIAYPVLNEGDLGSNNRNTETDPVVLLYSRNGNLSIPLKKGDELYIRAEWTSPVDAVLTLSGQLIVSTSEHECSAHVYIPALYTKDDWSGVKQVKAIVPTIGTFTMNYNAQENCWESHERLKLPKNGEHYTVKYEVYDSCHNMATDSCFIYVKDRIKPVPVMDKSVTISLGTKKVWAARDVFDEGSYDNCGVNFILVRRGDWETSCVNLCDSIVPCYVGNHHDTLWEAKLSLNKHLNPVEAHYAKTLNWLCEDETPCGELIYNSWLYSLIKHATIRCKGLPYTEQDPNFRTAFEKAYYESAIFRSKFERCYSSKEEHQNTASIFSPFRPEFQNIVDAYEQIGGGWSDSIAFDCEDACHSVTVELLVMDYWCNWSKVWNKVWVEDKTPVSIVQEVSDFNLISCQSYRDKIIAYPGESHPVNIEYIVTQAKSGEQQAFDILDDIFGGYEKAWKNEYGQFVDEHGSIIASQIEFYDSVCYCEEYSDKIFVYDEHLGNYWKDTVFTRCYYQPDTIPFRQGIIQVNCSQTVHCVQEVWEELDHCGQGFLYRKFKFWHDCPDSAAYYLGETPGTHQVDTITRLQRILIGQKCQLNKYMFDFPPDISIETCGIEYDDAGNVTGELAPEYTGKAHYLFEDDCRLLGISYHDKVFKVVGGEEACYKIRRTWFIADWCPTGPPLVENWWNYRELVVDSCVQHILIFDKVKPVCSISGPVPDGDTIETGACAYNLNVTVDVQETCGLAGYEWQLYAISGSSSVLGNYGSEKVFNGATSFPLEVDELTEGQYLLKVTVEDDCQNESYCDYRFYVKKVKKPSVVCFTSVTVRLTPWDLQQDGVTDTALATVWATDLDRSSLPACGDEYVDFRIQILRDGEDMSIPDLSSDQAVLGCSDIGTTLARLWVISQPSGQADYCDVVLIVQSDYPGCQPQNTGDRISLRDNIHSSEHLSSNLRGSDDGINGPGIILGKQAVDYNLLGQNFPNPFTGETTIGFFLRLPMEVTLSFTDVQGKALKMVQGSYAQGYHEITLHKRDFPGQGVVIYKLETKDFSEIRRMIIH